MLPGPVPSERMDALADAYTAAIAEAGDDIRVGSTSTRWAISSIVVPIGETSTYFRRCWKHAVGSSAGLSAPACSGRTLRPHTAAQGSSSTFGADHPTGHRLHPDDRRVSTRQRRHAFRPRLASVVEQPGGRHFGPRSKHEDQVLACGPPGSLIVFNGSTGMAILKTDRAGRVGRSKARCPSHRTCRNRFRDTGMQPDTQGRLSELARHVLAL